MKKTILNLLLLIPIFCIAQKKDCSPFKTGNFIMTSEMFPGIEIAIFRDEMVQIEEQINNGSKESKLNGKLYEKIEWLSDCKYKLTFDLTRGEVTDLANYINNNGGIITTILEVDDYCYTFISNFNINGKTQTVNGKICKDISN